jgi:hypothetical protein
MLVVAIVPVVILLDPVSVDCFPSIAVLTLGYPVIAVVHRHLSTRYNCSRYGNIRCGDSPPYCRSSQRRLLSIDCRPDVGVSCDSQSLFTTPVHSNTTVPDVVISVAAMVPVVMLPDAVTFVALIVPVVILLIP